METASKKSQRRVRFQLFELDLNTRELYRNGQRLKLHGHPIDILAILLERPGELVTRKELQTRLWPQNTFVDFEHILNNSIRMLRETLGDRAEAPRFVETIPRLGYRFIARVEIPSLSYLPAIRKWRRKLAAAAGTLAAHWISATTFAAILAFIVMLYVLNVAGLRSRIFGGVRLPRIGSIAVLPLQNLSGDPEQKYFADGMTEELITDLGRTGALRVISRTSVMQYKGTRKSLPEIAHELHVDAIVEGAVLRSGNRVRITAQLIDARDDRHLWAASYERDLRDVLELQADVAYAIVNQVNAHIAPPKKLRAANAQTVNPVAYDHYLKARFHYYKWQPNEFQLAIEEFQKAIDDDPGWAPPYVGLANSYGWLWITHTLSSQEALPKFNAALETAMEINDTLPEVRFTLAVRAFYYRWNWAEAEREFQRALSLDPNYVEARYEYAWFLSSMGRFTEAIAQAKRAIASDPLSVPANLTLASIYADAHHDDLAIAQWRKIIDLAPNDPRAYQFLSNLYARKRDYEKSMASLEKATSLSGAPPEVIAALDQTYRSSGYKGILKTRLEKKTDPYSTAFIQLQLGNRNQALASLEQAYAEHSWAMVQLKSLPGWDPLRSDPRFKEILRRMNFPP